MADPKIVYDIVANAEGGGEVERLALSLEKLDNAIDPAAATRAQALATELQRLGAEQAAVARFQELGTATEKARSAMVAADAAAAALRTEIAASGEPTTAQAGRLERLGAAAQAARADFNAQAAALEASRARLAALGVDSTQAAAASEALASAITGTREQLQGLGQSLQGVRARELVTDLQQLGQQQAAIQQLRDLGAGADKARAGLASAEQALETYRAKLAGIEAPTAAQVNQQQRLGFAVEDVRAKLLQQNEALDAARGRLEGLGVETRNLATAEERLRTAAQATVAQLQALGQAAGSARAAAAEVDALAAAERRLQQESAAAKQALESAFGAVGIRSLEAIRAEVVAVERAVNLLEAQMRQGAVSQEAFARAAGAAAVRLRELQTEASTIKALPGTFEQLNGTISGLVTRFGALAGAITGIAFGVKPLFDLAVQLDSMHRALTTLTGSSAEADKQIEFLRRTADKAGLSVSNISESFVRFTASTKGAGLSTELTQQVFTAAANAAGNLGLSSEKTTLILDALGQMASKGVVSMEELRQQLGDSLPGAMGLLAKGLGLTDQQLIKLVESGKLLAVDALPALADAMGSLASKSGQVTGLSASFNTLKNSVTETFAALTAADSAGGEASAGLLTSAAFAVRALALGFATLGEVVTLAGKKIGFTIAAIVSGDFKNLGAAIEEAETQGSARLQKLVERIDLFGEKAKGSTAPVAELGAATTTVGQQAEAAAVGLQKSADAQAAVGTAAAASAKAQGQAAVAAGATATAQTAAGAAAVAAGQGAATAGAQWVKLGVDYGDVNGLVEEQVKVSEKVVAAKKVEGEARVSLAQLSGNEYNALLAEKQAAEGNLGALQRHSVARQTEVGVLIAQRDALQAVAARLGDPDGSRQKEIDKITQTITARQVDADKAREQVNAQQAEVAQRELAVKTYGDNSAALGTLKAAYDQTRTAVQVTQQAEQAGAATSEQVTAAKQRAAAAERLYTDAVKDSAANTELKTAALQRTQQMTEIGIGVSSARIQTEQAYARSVGDTYTAVQKEIEQKRLGIDVINSRIATVKAETAATIEQANVELAALNQADPLYAKKRDEIQARIDNANAKRIETEVGQEQIKQIGIEINAIQARNAASAGSASASIDANNAADLSVLNKKNTTTMTPLSDNTGMFVLQEKLNNGALTLADKALVEGASKAIKFNNQTIEYLLKTAPGLVEANALQSNRDFVNVARRAQEKIAQLEANKKAADERAKYGLTEPPVAGTQGLEAEFIRRKKQEEADAAKKAQADQLGKLREGASPRALPSAGTSSSHTVVLKLPNGSSGTVSMASAADGDALTAMLKQLGQSARAAGATS